MSLSSLYHPSLYYLSIYLSIIYHPSISLSSIYLSIIHLSLSSLYHPSLYPSIHLSLYHLSTPLSISWSHSTCKPPEEFWGPQFPHCLSLMKLCLLNLQAHCVLFHIPLSIPNSKGPWGRNSRWLWGSRFLSPRGHSSEMPVVQCLKTVVSSTLSCLLGFWGGG